MLRSSLIKNFVLSLLSDELLKMTHDLVASRHHGLDFRVRQKAFCLLLEFVSIQGFELVEQLAIATNEVFCVLHVLKETKCAAEIHPPDLPVFCDQHICK